MATVVVVGAATALFGGFNRPVPARSFKKVLAYSTVKPARLRSSASVRARSPGFFHVFTHAFFSWPASSLGAPAR
jgi:NADH:ubiquinone oxidoreductase subunit 5 (subunit L)/multisubunit Na+/H+ antiporter MnhA subunit